MGMKVMSKTDKKAQVKKKEGLTELSKRESPVEKALKLGNDEVIARAIQDLLKRDEKPMH